MNRLSHPCIHWIALNGRRWDECLWRQLKNTHNYSLSRKIVENSELKIIEQSERVLKAKEPTENKEKFDLWFYCSLQRVSYLFNRLNIALYQPQFFTFCIIFFLVWLALVLLRRLFFRLFCGDIKRLVVCNSILFITQTPRLFS